MIEKMRENSYRNTDGAKMLEHLAKVKSTVRRSLNGLIVYTYNNGVSEPGYYNPQVMNIGDYVQSLAARQFLPTVDACIDRDLLGCYDGEPINMIMNGWYAFWKKNMTFSKAINPLMVAIHINSEEDLSAETVNYFKMHEPIGCRDINTVKVLERYGVSAYFSGCMTLTLGDTYRIPDSERENRVLFMDYWLGKNGKLDRMLLPLLHKYKSCDKVSLTKLYPLSMDIEGCFKEAEDIVKRFASSRLVITENIHCALPCLAVGTPVILMVPKYDHRRFEGLSMFLNAIGERSDGTFGVDVKRDKVGLVINPTEHIPYAAHLRAICKAFMGEALFEGIKASEFFPHQEFEIGVHDRRKRKTKILDFLRGL